MISAPNTTQLQEEREILETFCPGGDQSGDATSSVVRATGAIALETPFRLVNNTVSGRRSLIEEPYVIIVRHGQTEYNKLGIFTGWDDAPLAQEGRSGKWHQTFIPFARLLSSAASASAWSV